MLSELELDTVAIADQGSLAVRKIDNEFVLLNIRTGRYYSLENVAADIWEFFQKERSFRGVAKLVAEAYDIDKARSERDVMALCRQLIAEELLCIAPDRARD